MMIFILIQHSLNTWLLPNHRSFCLKKSGPLMFSIDMSSSFSHCSRKISTELHFYIIIPATFPTFGFIIKKKKKKKTEIIPSLSFLLSKRGEELRKLYTYVPPCDINRPVARQQKNEPRNSVSVSFPTPSNSNL
jgi:hypothetical protein